MLINVRNNKKLLGKVKAFDRHFNMVGGGTNPLMESVYIDMDRRECFMISSY